jgi:hypothetical protein
MALKASSIFCTTRPSPALAVSEACVMNTPSRESTKNACGRASDAFTI